MSNALPAWMYRDPCEIADGLIARSTRNEKAEKRKAEPIRKPKDRYYTQSRAIEISGMVKFRVKNGGSNAI